MDPTPGQLAADAVAAQDFARSIVETVRHPLVVLDGRLRVVSANAAFYRAFRAAPAETERRRLYDLGSRQWDIPELRALLEEVLPTNGDVADYEVVGEFPGLGERAMLLNARRMAGPGTTTDGHILLAIEDVTDRRHAERARRQSEERLGLALSAGGLGIWEWDITTDGAYWSPEAFAIFGVKPDKFGGTRDDFARLIHPDDRDTFWSKVGAALAVGGGAFEHEFRIVRPDGAGRWVINRGEPVRDAAGRAVRLVGVVADITDRKRAEAELLESRNQLRREHDLSEAIINTAPVIVLVLDPAGRVVRFNPFMEQLTGWPLAESRGRDWFETFIPSRDRDRIRGLFVRALTGDRTRANVNPVLARDGREFEIEWHDTPLRGPSGNLIGLLCVGQDVTARKRAEVSLHDREVRLAAILATAADAIITIDERGVIDSVNPAAERMFGYATAEMVGQNVKMLMPPPYRDAHDGYLANYLTTGVKKIIGIGREVQAQRKDGTAFPVELAVSEFFDAKRWFTGIIRDVSRRRELEREVLQAAAEEQRRIGRELHDSVGQELTGLGMLADALARQLDGSDVQRQLAGKVVEGLQRVHGQVRTLCRELVLTEMNGEGLRTALANLAARTQNQTGAECTLDCPEPVAPPGSIAAQHLYRIAQEAVANAVRHGKPAHVRIELHRTADGLRLCVEDDGSGVPNARELPWESRGLGLSTMRYRANLIGGSLHITPADGRGVRVVCIVPREEDNDQE